MIHTDITKRYIDILRDFDPVCEPVPGTELQHIRWMLEEIHSGRITGEKSHRWLGFIQGILIMNSLTTVQTERDFTRPYFTE